MTPKFIMLAAVSIDGRITKGNKPGSDWTSPEDKEFLHKQLDKCDAIIVGRTTYESAREPLSKRKCFVLTRAAAGAAPISENPCFINPEKLDIRDFFRDYKNIAVLGGTQTYDYFLGKGLIDEIYLTLEPLVFGSGKTIFNSEKTMDFVLESVKKLNQAGTVILHYIKEETGK